MSSTPDRPHRPELPANVDRAAAGTAWKSMVARFQHPNAARASWQLVNTVGTYVLLWVAIYWSLSISWWLTIPLAILAGGFLVRVFIIFHDCGHGSFFASRAANAFWGCLTGLLTWTPFYHWRGDHALHHGSSGDLDRRGIGDVWTMTVQEYLESTRCKRFAYRLARNPFVLFGIAPLVMMLITHRLTRRGAGRKERRSVWIMNAAVALMVAGMMLVFGVIPYVVVQGTILMVAGSVGIWLFFVQHQFEHVYWERAGKWDFAAAALEGSSYFRLPRVLQWFSGNIGFHHVHHLSPRIPNYYLEACHRSAPLFRGVRPIGIWQSLQSFGLRLWDESSQRLVGWRHMRKVRQVGSQVARGQDVRDPKALDE